MEKAKLGFTLHTFLFTLTLTLSCQPPAHQNYCLEFPLTHFLWRGFYQPVYINTPAEGTLMLKIPAGDAVAEVKKQGDQFEILPHRVGEVTVEVYLLKDGLENLLGTETIKVKELPNLKPRLPCIQGESPKVSVERLLSCPEIIVSPENFDVNVSFEVQSFNLVSFGENGHTIVSSSQSGRFSPEQIGQLKQLKPGQLFYLEDIMVASFAGVPQNAGILKFEVK